VILCSAIKHLHNLRQGQQPGHGCSAGSSTVCPPGWVSVQGPSQPRIQPHSPGGTKQPPCVGFSPAPSFSRSAATAQRSAGYSLTRFTAQAKQRRHSPCCPAALPGVQCPGLPCCGHSRCQGTGSPLRPWGHGREPGVMPVPRQRAQTCTSAAAESPEPYQCHGREPRTVPVPWQRAQNRTSDMAESPEPC